MGKMIQCNFKRYEKKYLLTVQQYQRMLQGMCSYMRSDRYGNYTLCNIYYDTEDYRLIRNSLEKPVYKEKLRLRSYGVPQTGDKVFVELKKKFDGVVYKRRVSMTAFDAVKYINDGVLPQSENQICHEIDWFMQSYCPVPKVFIAYDREAYEGIADPDLRITFDTNLRWRDTDLDLRKGDYGDLLLPSGKVLMEIKIPGAAPVWLAHLLVAVGAFPQSFSKYGFCYQNHILESHFTGGKPLEKKREEEVNFCA